MKKLLKIVVSGLSMLSLVLLAIVPVSAEEDYRTYEEGYYPKSSEAYISASLAMQSMYDLQNEITDNLEKGNGNYIYDFNTIKNIIYTYDFSEINKELNENWTKESFLNTVVESIDSTTVSNRSKRAYVKGPLCGVNKSDSIWNSKREYRDHSRTKKHADQLMTTGFNIQHHSANMTATGFDAVVASIALISPPIGVAMKTVKGGYSAVGWWMRTVSTSLTNSNKKNTCGTVLDINLVGVFSSWNQKDN